MKLCASNYGASGNGDNDDMNYDERLALVIKGSANFFKYIKSGATTYFYVLFHTHEMLDFAFGLMPVDAQHSSASSSSNTSMMRPRKGSKRRRRVRDDDDNM